MLRFVIPTLVLIVTANERRGEAKDVPSPDPPSRVAKVPTLEAVREAVAARDLLFHALKFRLDIQGRDHVVRGGPWRRRVQVVDAVCDPGGRVWADMWVSPLVPIEDAAVADAAAAGLHEIVARGAKESRTLMWTADGKRQGGFIEDRVAISWLTEPFYVLGLGQFNPAQYLDDPRSANLDGIETVNGEEAVRVKVYWEPSGYPGTAIGLNFWFSLAKGFALVQRERTFRPAAGLPMKVCERIRCLGLSPQGPLWLPATAETQNFHYDEKGYELDREFTSAFSGWTIDPPVSDKTFSVEFPDGTLVTDRIRDISYIKGSIRDPLIKSHVARAGSLGAKPPAPLVDRPDPGHAERFQTLSRDNRYSVEPGWGWWLPLCGFGIALLAMAYPGYRLFVRKTRSGAGR